MDEKSDIIKIPDRLLRSPVLAWGDRAFIYALDSSTIGISGYEIEEWNKESCFTDVMPIRNDGEDLVIKIPERFFKFYKLDVYQRTTTVSGNIVLITVTERRRD